MFQKPVIYVRRITNLSDARYCAGMGVDMLGFIIDPKDADYVSAPHYQEMIGWISGPKRVIEVTAATVDWNEIIQQYKPDLLHISVDSVNDPSLPDLPLILEVPFSDLRSYRIAIQNLGVKIDHLLISGFDAVRDSFEKVSPSILLALENDTGSVSEILHQTGANGIALQGSRELAPGLKDYEHLSKILEELEG